MSFHSKAFGQGDDAIAHYVQDLFCPEDETLARVRANAKKEGLPEIQVGVFDGRHLEILTRMLGAKKAVEIGTLGGYSGISISRGLGAGGKLHTFEISPHHATVARRCFDSAQLEAEVVIHVGPAVDNLASIDSEGPFDLVFIDADKVNYPNYLKWATENLRVGGAVIGDNTFAWGHIHETKDVPQDREISVKALREFNKTLATSSRFRSTILPTAEGLTVGIKLK
jgi:caffeoyl-CoA O-methyltransferase